jgi:hypothetical protein
MLPKETLIKDKFPNFSVCRWKMIFKRRRFVSGGLGSWGGSGLMAGLGRLFYLFNRFDSWFFHVVAVRAPSITLASPKSV